MSYEVQKLKHIYLPGTVNVDAVVFVVVNVCVYLVLILILFIIASESHARFMARPKRNPHIKYILQYLSRACA